MAEKIIGVFALLVLLALPGAVAAQTQSDMETQLRTALRSATTQLRQLQDDQATMQARQAEMGKQNEALRQQVETLTQQLAAQPAGAAKAVKAEPDRAGLEQAVAEFNRKLSTQNEALRQMNETLDKWKAAYNEAATVARAKEAERAQLAAKTDGLTQQATSCEAKNAELFKIGSEILDRYAHIGVGDALGAREPFIGFERVKLQNVVQDYNGQLLDQAVEQKATP
jgi:chromosome segregation ATPase